MNHQELLISANSLVQQGLHKSAIELLEPHVNDHPQDTKALRALSKIYLQDRQFLKAAACLRRALLPIQKQSPSNGGSLFKQDTFSEEDIRYTEDLASKYDESEYDFETDRKPPEPATSIERCQDISAPPNKNDTTAKTVDHSHKTPAPSPNGISDEYPEMATRYVINRPVFTKRQTSSEPIQ